MTDALLPLGIRHPGERLGDLPVPPLRRVLVAESSIDAAVAEPVLVATALPMREAGTAR